MEPWAKANPTKAPPRHPTKAKRGAKAWAKAWGLVVWLQPCGHVGVVGAVGELERAGAVLVDVV